MHIWRKLDPDSNIKKNHCYRLGCQQRNSSLFFTLGTSYKQQQQQGGDAIAAATKNISNDVFYSILFKIIVVKRKEPHIIYKLYQ